MSAVEKVKSIFSGLGSSYTSTPLTFTEIDVQKNKKKMRLKEEGTQRGSKNLPKPDAADFDDVEQQIISWVNNEAKTAAEDMHTHLISFQHRIQSMRGIGNVAKIDQIASLAEDSFSAKVQSTKAELFTVRESVRHIKAKFESFKNKYSLQGEASYPQSRFLHFSIVALIVGVETLVNGKFFGKVSEGGFLSGVTEAFAFSFINAILGFLLGFYVFRLCLYPSRVKKVLSVVLCGIIPICMLFMNLLLSWYRSMGAPGTGEAFSKATALFSPAAEIAEQSKDFVPHQYTLIEILHSVVIKLFSSLNSLDSVLLFSLGILCCIFITIDFWKMDDPFPGFGNISREYKTKIDDYADLNLTAVEELKEIQAEAYEKLEEVLSSVSAMSGESEAILESQDRWRRLFKAHIDHLEDSGKQLLSYYRSANSAARTANEPAHFNQIWSLKRPEIPEADQSFIAAISGIQSETRNVQETYISCVKRISDGFNRALEEYKEIEKV